MESSNVLGSTSVTASNLVSADSSVASNGSLDDEVDEGTIKVKKKDEPQVYCKIEIIAIIFDKFLLQKLCILLFRLKKNRWCQRRTVIN